MLATDFIGSAAITRLSSEVINLERHRLARLSNNLSIRILRAAKFVNIRHLASLVVLLDTLVLGVVHDFPSRCCLGHNRHNRLLSACLNNCRPVRLVKTAVYSFRNRTLNLDDSISVTLRDIPNHRLGKQVTEHTIGFSGCELAGVLGVPRLATNDFTHFEVSVAADFLGLGNLGEQAFDKEFSVLETVSGKFFKSLLHKGAIGLRLIKRNLLLVASFLFTRDILVRRSVNQMLLQSLRTHSTILNQVVKDLQD